MILGKRVFIVGKPKPQKPVRVTDNQPQPKQNK
jgi:hypothetical protein